MFAGGKFRHHATVFGVQLDLRGDGAGQDPAIAHDGGAGFVAGSFKGQQDHGKLEILQRFRRFIAGHVINDE